MGAQTSARKIAPIDDRERIAWLRPLVIEMRDRLRRIELSRFWKFRNAFFGLKHRLGFSADSAWDVFELPTAYAAMLDDVDAYATWRVRNDPRPSDLADLRRYARALAATPSFEIVVAGTGAAYEATIASVRAQAYPNWVVRAETDGTADFLMFVDPGDVLSPDALFAFAAAIAGTTAVDLVYADEDTLGPDGRRSEPQFKPDWSPETLLSRDYIGKAVVYRTASYRAAGAMRARFAAAARYDLTLRVSERARAIVHVPKVLYHAHAAAGSEAGAAYVGHAADAISESLARRGDHGSPVATGPRTFAVRYALDARAKVSILLPTRDHAEDLERCLASLFTTTTFADFEVLLIDNGSKEPAALDVIERYRKRDARLRVVPMDVPFNYSRLNNAAQREASGSYIVLLNNDTEIVTPDWIEAMMEQAQRPAIGAVGAHLLYPDGAVQHGGVILGIGGVAGHRHRGAAVGSSGAFDSLRTVTNYSAVTAACLMVRTAVYEEVGGLDEALTVAFNDVDFCLRVLQAGYRNVWLPHVVLVHGESRSRGHDVGLLKTHRSLAEQRVMLDRWRGQIENDPYYSPHLTRRDESCSIGLDV